MSISTTAMERAMLNEGLTGAALAGKANLSQFTISKYKLGKVSRINPVTLKKIADALHVKAETLLAE